MDIVSIMLVGAVGAVTALALLPENKRGFYKPRENVAVVVLRGGTLHHTELGKTQRFITRDNHSKKILTDTKNMEVSSPLFDSTGYRCYGVPLVDSLAQIKINYPPQLRSMSSRQHEPNEIVYGLDVAHTYIAVGIDVDFQGGMPFNLLFVVEVKLDRPDICLDRNGMFLNLLGQLIEGAIKQTALTINIADFVGKIEEMDIDLTDKKRDAKRNDVALRAVELRNKMCEACMNLNIDTNQGTGPRIPLSQVCGYKIKQISYNDIEAVQPQSIEYLAKLQELNVSRLRVQISKNEQAAENNLADAAAYKIEKEGGAAAQVTLQNNLNKVKTDEANGIAQTRVLKERRLALGDSAFKTDLKANALSRTQVHTLVQGGRRMSMMLPAASAKQTEAEPKPDPKLPIKPVVTTKPK